MSRAPDVWQPAEAPAARLGLPEDQLPAGWHGHVDADGVALVSERWQRVVSSGPLFGGLGEADAWINQRIDETAPLHIDGPAAWIDRAAAERGLPATCVGMMTAAGMRSLRIASGLVGDARISVLATLGLSNARRAGDPADEAAAEARPSAPRGTINMALLLPAGLADHALIDTVVTLTEAKTVALAEAEVRSRRTGRIATGTGTDALAIFCPAGPVDHHAAGKHTALGETIARLTIDALHSAIAGMPCAGPPGV